MISQLPKRCALGRLARTIFFPIAISCSFHFIDLARSRIASSGCPFSRWASSNKPNPP
jgi:hypothetical protein